MVGCTSYRSDDSCDDLAKFEEGADNFGNLEKTQNHQNDAAQNE